MDPFNSKFEYPITDFDLFKPTDFPKSNESVKNEFSSFGCNVSYNYEQKPGLLQINQVYQDSKGNTTKMTKRQIDQFAWTVKVDQNQNGDRMVKEKFENMDESQKSFFTAVWKKRSQRLDLEKLAEIESEKIRELEKNLTSNKAIEHPISQLVIHDEFGKNLVNQERIFETAKNDLQQKVSIDSKDTSNQNQTSWTKWTLQKMRIL